MKNLIILQTCVPDYRVKIYNYITSCNDSVRIIAGDMYYTPSIKSVKKINNVIWIKNIFFLKRKLLFQKVPWRMVFKTNALVIEFNLRNLSLYPIVFFRFFLKKKHIYGVMHGLDQERIQNQN